MRGTVAAGLGVAVLLLLPSLGAVPAAEPTEPQVTDPQGDANEWHTRDVLNFAAAHGCGSVAGAVGGVGGGALPGVDCNPVFGAAGMVPDQQAVPAPPALDGLAVRFLDTPEHLLVELELAALDDGLSGAVDGEDGKGTAWTVCWGPDGDPCNEYVRFVATMWNGVPMLLGSFNRHWDVFVDEPCTDYHHCWWRVDVDILAGSPGHLRWTVPRDLLMEGEAGATLLRPFFFIDRLETLADALGLPTGFAATAGIDAGTAGVPVFRYATGAGTQQWHGVDASDRGMDYALATPRTPVAFPSARLFVTDPAGDIAQEDAQVDILAAGVVETPTTLTVSVSMGLVFSLPRNQEIDVFFATPAGHHYWLTFWAHDGVVLSRAMRTAEPSGGFNTIVPIEVERVQGAPGWVNFTLQRHMMVDDVERGGLLRSFSAFTLVPFPDQQPGNSGLSFVPASLVTAYNADRAEYLPPMRLAYATGEAPALEAASTGLPLEAGVLGLGLVTVAAVATAGAASTHRRRTRADAALVGSVALAPGALFGGRYRVLRELGRGGSGEVFLARDETMAREVVLKRLAGDLRRDAVALERFRREAQLAGALQHPHIVTVHDTVVVGEEAVLVMEYVRGGTLADKLRQGPLPEAEAVRIALDALSALQDLHGRGIVHRDVKPSNLLLDERGRAKLSDFGVARDVISGETVGVGRRSMVGTYAYMAPELARGMRASPQSDQYALAATLYEALAGHPPVPVEGLAEFEARAKLLREAPRLPLPGASRAVNRALARALAKDPELRFEDAAAMARALRG